MPAMINSYNEESTVEIEDLERFDYCHDISILYVKN